MAQPGGQGRQVPLVSLRWCSLVPLAPYRGHAALQGQGTPLSCIHPCRRKPDWEQAEKPGRPREKPWSMSLPCLCLTPRWSESWGAIRERAAQAEGAAGKRQWMCREEEGG